MLKPYVTFTKILWKSAIFAVLGFCLYFLARAVYAEDVTSSSPIYAMRWTPAGAPTWTKIANGREIITVGTTPDGPDDPDDPPPEDTLKDRTEARARIIAEPAVASNLSQLWAIVAKAMREDGTTWAKAASGIPVTSPALWSGSPKASQWEAFTTTTIGEINGMNEKTAATVQQVADGLAAAAGGASAIKIEKLMCIINFWQCWTSIPAQESPSDSSGIPIPGALPSVLKTSSLGPRPDPTEEPMLYTNWVWNMSNERMASRAATGQ